MEGKTKGVRRVWEKYKFVVLIVLIGIGLLLWPGGKTAGRPGETAEQSPAETRQAESDMRETAKALQCEMEEVLGTIQGVGQTRVLLTLDSDGERQLAQNTELSYRGDTAAPEDYSRSSKVVLAENGTRQGEIVTRQTYPSFRGALVVCQGGDRAEVCLKVTEAVSALTGLSSDRITVAKWQ